MAPRITVSRRVRAVVLASVTAAMLCTTLAACTAEPEPQEVATLEESGAAETPDAASPTASAEQTAIDIYGEPQRAELDWTQEQFDAAYAVYEECMADRLDAVDEPEGSGVSGAASPAMEEADAFCVSLQPLIPWEMDPANPEAAQIAQRVVDCLRDLGVEHVEVQTTEEGPSVALGGEANDGQSIALGMEHIDECYVTVSEDS